MPIRLGGGFVLVALLAMLCIGSGPREAESQPVPPCGAEDSPVHPAYARSGAPPAVGVWRDLKLEPGDCLGSAGGHVDLVIALATRFEHAGTLEDLAARAGAISATEGTRYWSVSDGEWRTLVQKAYAVEDPATRAPRPDFTAEEILGGRTLFFAQDDTRSTGTNVYSLKGWRLGPDHLAIEIVNVTDIRFLLVALFQAETMVSLHFLKRLDKDIWGYYGLSTVRNLTVGGHTRSMINRAAAYQRFITGMPTDEPPPLAP